MSNIVKMPSQSWPQQNWSGSWPPSCSCGCSPCQCGGGWGGLMQCWQDIAQFQQFLMAMLSQMGPYPMQGVTDGSNAAPGNIGEYIILKAGMSYAASPAVTQQIVSVGVLPPGDWDITCTMLPTTQIGGTTFNLSPVPAGISNPMWGSNWSSPAEDVIIIGQSARGSFTVPTLLAFNTTVSQVAAGLTAGTANFDIEARRAR